MPLTFNDNIPVETLREIFIYDPETGVLRWKTKHARKVIKGTAAGHLAKSGYVLIRILGGLYRAHRIAWAIHTGSWPKGELDHENRIRNDNRILNLREAGRSEQIANTKINRTNTSGYRGVSFVPTQNKNRSPRTKPWLASMRVNGKYIYLGFHLTAEEASLAYEKEAIKRWGIFYFRPCINPPTGSPPLPSLTPSPISASSSEHQYPPPQRA